jgi:hypothetical protein
MSASPPSALANATEQTASLDELAGLDALNLSILHELVSEGGDVRPLSLPRLGKRLGLGASVLLRQLSAMGEARLAGQSGPGWVRVERVEPRWLVHLNPAGRLQYQRWLTLLEQAEAQHEAARQTPVAQSKP